MARAHIAPSKTSTGAADAIAPSTARGSQPASACDILVIEDDLGIADVLRLALQREGHTVDVAADGDEGLTYLQQRHYRLLLLDLLLPRLDGMGVLRALREEPVRRPPVVIILSAMRTEAAVLTALIADVQAAATVERDEFAVHPRAAPVSVLLADAIASARALPGAHPVTATTTTHERVWADPERIGQVLRNLLANAAKYSPAGTPIEVR